MHRPVTNALYRETIRCLYRRHGRVTDTKIIEGPDQAITSVTTLRGVNVGRAEYTKAIPRGAVVRRCWLDLDLLPADSFGPNVRVTS